MTEPDAVTQAWLAAGAAEQVAAFGYDVLGPWLAGAPHILLARTCEQAHRALIGVVQTIVTSPAAAPPNYQLPIRAVDDQSGQQLAIVLEERAASAWRYVLAQLAASPPVAASSWSTAVSALSASAVRAVQWRQLSTPDQASVAFPGF